jgi:hypothetical protein
VRTLVVNLGGCESSSVAESLLPFSNQKPILRLALPKMVEFRRRRVTTESAISGARYDLPSLVRLDNPRGLGGAKRNFNAEIGRIFAD